MTIGALDSNILDAIAAFVSDLSPRGRLGRVFRDGAEPLPYVDVGDVRYVLGKVSPPADGDDVLAILRGISREHYETDKLSNIVFGIHGLSGPAKSLRLGIRVMPMADTVAALVGLSESWRKDQTDRLTRALSPLEGATPVPMRGRTALQDVEDAQKWLSDRLLSPDAGQTAGSLVFVRAEAGKGKTTLLATMAREFAAVDTIPVPLFIPLRELTSGRGVSWEEILRTVGVGTANSTRAALAVRHGLLLPVLDGLDEVAGRYDPQLVRDLLDIVPRQLAGPRARVVLSGRTTEAARIESETWSELELELPKVDAPAFSDYVSGAARRAVSSWSETVLQLPPEILDRLELKDIESASDAQLDAIVRWICEIFEDLGKDRSLFFIQSLAGIARSRQLAGNKPLLISGSAQPPWRPSIYNVCLLAAAMACAREQTKVETIAQKAYTAERQIRLLVGLALHASVEPTLRSRLPKANFLAKDIFDIDPVNANELLTAILRQNQKHALLYSRGDSIATGDWRPDFLSAWIRNTLLVWAWLHPSFLPGITKELICESVVRAQQARLAFSELFPALLEEEEETILGELANELAQHTAQASVEAATNHWLLWVSLPPEARSKIPSPVGVPDGADLAELEVADLVLDARFSGSTFFLNGAVFEDCFFESCSLRGVDLAGVQFRRCTFRDVMFEECDGPVQFDDCCFMGTRIVNTRTSKDTPLTFLVCEFRDGTRIEQVAPAYSGSQLRSVVAFSECTSAVSVTDLLVGDWIGVAPKHVKGLNGEGQDANLMPWEACLRAMLRPFFPTRVGESQIAARRYIRLSALGRGRFPLNTPSPSDLRVVLESAGFNTGGRTEHLYAPWASVNGPPASAIKLRNEMLDFLRNGTHSLSIVELLGKLRRFWE